MNGRLIFAGRKAISLATAIGTIFSRSPEEKNQITTRRAATLDILASMRNYPMEYVSR
jgi:hypothetical protein